MTTAPRNKKGDRVTLIRTTDEYSRLRPGTTGIVTLVDSLGTVHVNWDDGSRLGLVAAAGDDWSTQ